MFPVVVGKRGCSLADSTGFGDKMASACVVLRHFREIAESIGMPREAAKVIRRHSWRHFGANVTRVAEFAEAKKSQVGRWGSLEVMPVRYAQEVENVAMMGIILEIEKVLEEALRRVPLEKWPWLAGWEHLSPHVLLRPAMVKEIPMECMPESVDRSDDEDSEVEEGSDVEEEEPREESNDEADRVVQAWDTLQRDKVAARATVGAWTLEFVLRRNSEGSVGDCYAKRAGQARVRSRVALLAALGVTAADGAGRAAPQPGDDAAERGEDTEATEGKAPQPEDGAVKKGEDTEATEGKAPQSQADAVEKGEEIEATEGKRNVKRPHGMPCELWKIRRGGFPDGDTSLSPPKAARRSRG